MRRFDAVLFDLGWTLVYFDGDWTEVLPRADAALFRSLQSSGLQLKEDFSRDFREAMKAYYRRRDEEFVECTTHDILSRLLAQYGYPEVSGEVITRALAALHAVSQAHWKLAPDTLPTLQILKQKGYRLAVISNAGDDADVQKLVDNAGIRAYFDLVMSSASQGIRKPNPEIFWRALRLLGVEPARAVMVGDMLGTDIQGAINAGVYSIWLTTWANRPAVSSNPSQVQPAAQIERLCELIKILEG